MKNFTAAQNHQVPNMTAPSTGLHRRGAQTNAEQQNHLHDFSIV